MSAPKTNLETQKKRHRGPLIGMALAVGFGVALVLYWILDESAPADNGAGPGETSLEQGTSVEGVETGTVAVPDTTTAPVNDPATPTPTPPPAP